MAVFKLEINLDNAEVDDLGLGDALHSYLIQVAKRCQDKSAFHGAVIDVNGNTIGKYIIDDSPR